MHEAIRAFRRDLNAVMSRGVWRIFAIAMREYQHTLESHALLDFSGVLERAVQLLKDMDEFAESRLRLEARHRHVLVDEFQDTSRAQWELVRQLVKSWGEGFGAAADAIPPSIFIVGDRKQSIYGFRDADVAMVDEAAAFIDALRPDGSPRQAITVSFRSAPGILAFVNEVFAAIVDGDATNAAARRDAFRYGESDRFPVRPADSAEPVRLSRTFDDPVRFIAGDTVQNAADARRRRNRPAAVRHDGARSDDRRRARGGRRGHRDPVPLARQPSRFRSGARSPRGLDLRLQGARLLRRRRDPGRRRAAALSRRSAVGSARRDAAAIAHRPALGWRGRPARQGVRGRDPERRAAAGAGAARATRIGACSTGCARAVPRWLSWVDRLAPSELLDAVLHETAYAFELRGSRRRQARENVKKLRGMIRRAQNRGYATLARIADHLERLAVGDESNAAIDAIDAVSLMTVHAAKGLEFPIVFVVNMGRGTGGFRAPIRVTDDAGGEASVAIADYQSEADEDVAAREREESKRLLYVALTRARDRLYLSATVKDGVCRMGKGSLGEVLPAAIRARFVARSGRPGDGDAFARDRAACRRTCPA